MIYDFRINRNFTSIVGDSGAGKTHFIDCLLKATSQEFGDGAIQYTLYCDVPCISIPSDTQYIYIAG